MVKIIKFILQEYTKLKLALLGKGKTGSKILELSQWETTVFDSSNPPTKEALSKHDVIVSFLPGPAFESYISMIMDSGVPLVTGSTGLTWPEDLDKKLQEKKLTWVRAANFSLAMVLVKKVLETFSLAENIFGMDGVDFEMEETHHTSKKDAPSGTALQWANWVNKNDMPIKSHRLEDQVGTHVFKLKTPFEEMELSHKSLDRNLFAQGALYAANKILHGDLPYGLIEFTEIVEKDLV